MSFHLILEYYGGLSVLVLSTEHMARFKHSRNDQNDVVFLCQNELILVDGAPSAKLVDRNNSKSRK